MVTVQNKKNWKNLWRKWGLVFKS